MDGTRFDELTKRFGAGLNRRQVLRGLLGGAGAITVAGAYTQSAEAQACDPNNPVITCPAGTHHAGLSKKDNGQCCLGNGNCCSNVCDNGTCVAATGPECSEEGVECSETAPCCVDLNLECSTDDICVLVCAEEGESCAGMDCCEGLTCLEDVCEVACSEEKEACEVDGDCCGDLLCGDDSVCEQPPGELPETGVAGGSSDSTGILGVGLAGGAAALIAAKVLRRKPASDTPEA
jgi:hypothetical protein